MKGSNGHTAGIALTQKNIELAVAAYETGLSIQIWKHPNDDFGLVVRSPGGEEVQLETRRIATIREYPGTDTAAVLYWRTSALFSESGDLY